MDDHPDLSKLVFQFSPEIEQLAGALAKAQGAFKNAKKDGNNSHLNSNYAGLSSVMDCVRLPLSENGIAIMQPVSMISTGEQGLITMLVHESGQWVKAILPIPKLELKGLNDLQAFGYALSYLRRYMLQSIVGLASEDNDAAAHSGKKNPPHQSQAGFQNPRPASQGSASKGAPPAAQGTPPASPAKPEGSNTPPDQDGLPTLGGVTFNQVNGEIHAIGKATYDHKDALKACGFSFRSSDKVWYKKAA
ncbi:MAG: hypothetical protein ACD_74C00069G0015 [uncultured bacterium]|nr:MAG: hypothetical protein ACD_74C00069G0015 [uncultured bacterium]